MYEGIFHVYQIGDMLVPPYSKRHLPTKLQITSTPRPLLMSNEVVFPVLTRASVKHYNLEMDVFGDHLLTKDQYRSRLTYLAQKEIDVFAYLDMDECPVPFGDGEDIRSETGLLWFHNRAAISNYSDSINADNGALSISLEFDTKTFWYPVNRLEWEYRPYAYNPSHVFNMSDIESDLIASINPYPRWQDIEHADAHGKRWAKRNIIDDTNGLNWLFNKNLWEGLVDYLAPMSPPIGHTTTILIGETDRFTVDRSIFDQICASYYRMPLSNSDLALVYDQGEITVTIVDDKYIWDESTRTVTIDLDELNTDLDDGGYGGVTAGDVLYFGAWDIRPGFIIRDGEILPVFANIQYDTDFPGQAEGGEIEILFDGNLISTWHEGMSLDCLHYFRRD